MKFAFVIQHRSIWPVAWMCSALSVSRSGFHAWLTRQTSRRAQDDAAILTKVQASFAASDRTYGGRRIWYDVLADGIACGLHRIERLMRENAVQARPLRRGLPQVRQARRIRCDWWLSCFVNRLLREQRGSIIAANL